MSEEAERRTLTITLNRDAVSGPALSTLRLAGGAIVTGLKAIDSENLTGPMTVEARGVTFQFEAEVENDEGRKAGYRAWLLAKGFQDLVRGLRESLEAAHVWIDWVQRHGLPLAPGGAMAIQTELVEAANRKNFPDLMRAVNLGLSSPLHWEEAFMSMQKVRSCLEHRAGLVHQQRDAGAENPSLRLSIPRLQLTVQDGDREVELVPNLVVEHGGHVLAKPAIRIHDFPVGSVVRFSANDFGEIAFACWMMAQELVSKLPNPPVNTTAAAPRE